jgi:hypothetical protein
MGFKGARFATTEGIKSNAMVELRKPVLSTIAGSLEQMYVYARTTL